MAGTELATPTPRCARTAPKRRDSLPSRPGRAPRHPPPEITLLVLAPPKPACLSGLVLLLYVKTLLRHMLPAPAGRFLPNHVIRKKAAEAFAFSCQTLPPPRIGDLKNPSVNPGLGCKKAGGTPATITTASRRSCEKHSTHLPLRHSFISMITFSLWSQL